MAAAILAFSVQDAAIKWLSRDYGLAQIIFFSRILAVPFAALLAYRSGGLAQLRTKRPLLQVMRASLTVCDMLCFTAAVWLMPLADAITIGFAAPLFMTILSVPLLKERVGPRRWTAVLLGFIGVVIVLQPSGAGYGLPSLYALGSALAFALLIIADARADGDGDRALPDVLELRHRGQRHARPDAAGVADADRTGASGSSRSAPASARSRSC